MRAIRRCADLRLWSGVSAAKGFVGRRFYADVVRGRVSQKSRAEDLFPLRHRCLSVFT